jgi:hypothetical protein
LWFLVRFKGDGKLKISDHSDIEKLFKFQNIATEPYVDIGIDTDDGVTVALSRAYFMGVVDGKRAERKRHKNAQEHKNI